MNGYIEGKLTESEAAGMTVNERLYLAGLMESFDKALAERNETEIKHILKKVYFSPEDREAITKQLLDN